MKKVLLILLIFPIFGFGQGDFRKLSWGQSIEDLKKAYPEIQFEKRIDSGCDILRYFGDLIGIEAQIVYVFLDNKFIAGMYYLDPLNKSKSSVLRLKDYKNISSRLRDKYAMRNEDEWIKSNWKKYPDELDFAVKFGHVTLVERSEIGDTYVTHTLSQNGNQLNHLLSYASDKWVKIMQQKQNDDF
jgi:hypothetical protein